MTFERFRHALAVGCISRRGARRRYDKISHKKLEARRAGARNPGWARPALCLAGHGHSGDDPLHSGPGTSQKPDSRQADGPCHRPQGRGNLSGQVQPREGAVFRLTRNRI